MELIFLELKSIINLLIFDESEIRVLNNIAETFEKECIKQEKEVLKWYEEQNGKE